MTSDFIREEKGGGIMWDQDDASTSQGIWKVASDHRKLERHQMDSPSQPPEGANPANTLISDFWPPKLCVREKKKATVLSHLVCGTLLWQPQETNINTWS